MGKQGEQKEMGRMECYGHAQAVRHVNSFRPHGLQLTRLLCPWGFSRQEYWSGWPCPPPGDLPNPGTEPRPPGSPALAGRFLTTEPPGKLYRRASRPQKAKRKSWTRAKGPLENFKPEKLDKSVDLERQKSLRRIHCTFSSPHLQS